MNEVAVVTWFPPAALYSGSFRGVCDEINTSSLEEALLGGAAWPDYLPGDWLRERIGWMLTPSFWRETLPHGRASAALSWSGGGRVLDATLAIAARVVHATLGEEDGEIAGTIRFPTLVLFEISLDCEERRGARPALRGERKTRVINVVTTAIVRVPIADAVAT